MAELFILGLVSICSAVMCLRYILYKCNKESEYIVQNNVIDDEVPPKYEDINT